MTKCFGIFLTAMAKDYFDVYVSLFQTDKGNDVK